MTKLELIRVALTELRKQWNVGENAEWFQTLPDAGFESEEVVIKWTPQVKVDSQHHYTIPKAVTITRKKDGRFFCVIHDTASSFKNEKSITDFVWYWQITKLNREFNALREKIVEYKRTKENNHFLSDLIKVFPQSMDGAILGDEYDE